MKKKWKYILGGILVALIAGFTIVEIAKPLEVKVLEVQPGRIASTIREEGMVVPAIQEPIYSLYGGQIVELLVQEGEEVKAGDLLAQINRKELDFQLEQLYAQLRSLQGEKAGAFQETNEIQIASQELLVEQARQDVEIHKLNFERIAALHQAGGTSQKDFADAQAILEKAEKQLALQEKTLTGLKDKISPGSGTQQFFAGRMEALQAQVDMLEYQKEQTRIIAPLDGIVSNLAGKKGDVVGPVTFLMNVFQPESFEVEVFVLTEDVHSIGPGMEADLLLARRDQDLIYRGQVKQIAPTATGKLSTLGLEEQRIRVTLAVDKISDGKLFPGSKLDVEFTTEQQEDVLIVPRTALFPYGDGEALWLVKNGKGAIQPVETGFNNNLNVVITHGLSPGDLVVLNPQLATLSEGKRIKAVRRPG